MHKVLGSQLCFQNIYFFIYKGYTFGEKVLLLKVTIKRPLTVITTRKTHALIFPEGMNIITCHSLRKLGL